MKLSKNQQKVINLLEQGWELGQRSGIDGGCWMQRNGLGKGGESLNVSSATVIALYKRGLIKHTYGFPWSTWTLA